MQKQKQEQMQKQKQMQMQEQMQKQKAKYLWAALISIMGCLFNLKQEFKARV